MNPIFMSEVRHNWTKQEILEVYNRPMMELLYDAATIHRKQHDPNVVQVSTLYLLKLVDVLKIVDTVRKQLDITQV